MRLLKFHINIAVSTFPPGQEGVGGWQGLGAVLSNGSRCRLLNGDYRHSLTDRQTHLHGHCEHSSSRAVEMGCGISTWIHQQPPLAGTAWLSHLTAAQRATRGVSWRVAFKLGCAVPQSKFLLAAAGSGICVLRFRFHLHFLLAISLIRHAPSPTPSSRHSPSLGQHILCCAQPLFRIFTRKTDKTSRKAKEEFARLRYTF